MKLRVRAIKELPEIKLVKRKLGPLAVGDELELWLWDVSVLKRNGIVDVPQALTAGEVRKLILSEERSLEITQLPEDFYSSITSAVSILSFEGKKDEANELMAQTRSLLEIRLPKLVKLALSPEAPAVLPVGERFLVNNVAELVENWTRRLSKSFELGEEVEKYEVGESVQHAAGNEAHIQEQGVSATELHT